MTKGVQIAVGATAMGLLMGWYAATNLAPGAAFTYYQSLEELRSAAAAGADGHARVHGYVSDGSIERDLEGKQVRFVVQNDAPHLGGSGGPRLDVVFGSLETPDLFKDGAEVVVEGRLVESDGRIHFHADKVMAKCPSKFEGREGKPAQTASFN